MLFTDSSSSSNSREKGDSVAIMAPTTTAMTTNSKPSIKEETSVVKLADQNYAVLAALGLVSITPLLQKFNISEKEYNNNADIKDALLQCDRCDKYFANRDTLIEHYAEAHKSKMNFYCKICSKLFPNRTELQAHRNYMHNGKNPYICTLCPLSFVCLEALTAHVRRHNGKLPYTCKTCNQGFELYQELKDHQPVHQLAKKSDKKKPKHCCSVCDRQFNKPCDLGRHIRVHTGEKPFACSVCGNRFQQAHNLTKHMHIHTREKEYECDLCKKVFGRSDVLARHMLTHAIKKPHQCEFCPQNFIRSAQLIDHMVKKHSGEENHDDYEVAPKKRKLLERTIERMQKVKKAAGKERRKQRIKKH